MPSSVVKQTEGETKLGMELQVGSILEGKVTTITKFGAFVALEGGKSGLVHISEIANTFVNDVHDFLQEGQTVKVLVLSTENGKINLSIKKTQPQERPAPRPATGGRPVSRPAPQQPRSFSRPPRNTVRPKRVGYWKASWIIIAPSAPEVCRNGAVLNNL